MSSLTWRPALAWRMRQQMLTQPEDRPVESVVRRLGAVQAQAEFAAELSVDTRRTASQPGDVAAALIDGRLIKTFAFRGATHLMTPEEGAIYLAIRSASKMWELPSWQSYYGLKPSDWPAFRASVRDALADGPLTRSELGAAVTASPQFSHLGFAFEDGAGTLLKPLAWQGDMSLGSTSGRTTFQRLDANPRWPGVLDLDEAGPRAVAAYVTAYGPATPKHLQYWLGEGLGTGRKRIDGWIGQLGARLVQVDVDGEPAFVLREDLDDLQAASDQPVVRLLPSFDQWLLGPGTTDRNIVSPERRALVSRGASVVIASGVVSGTWSLRRDRVAVDWFAEAGPLPRPALADEIERLGRILGRELEPAWE